MKIIIKETAAEASSTVTEILSQQVIAKEHYGGAFPRDVGPRSHGDPHIRLHQRRRVVDSVSDHGYYLSFGTELTHTGNLLFGEQLGFNPIHPEIFRDGIGDSERCLVERRIHFQ